VRRVILWAMETARPTLVNTSATDPSAVARTKGPALLRVTHRLGREGPDVEPSHAGGRRCDFLTHVVRIALAGIVDRKYRVASATGSCITGTETSAGLRARTDRCLMSDGIPTEASRAQNLVFTQRSCYLIWKEASLP
jgi:hypothetical protein